MLCNDYSQESRRLSAHSYKEPSTVKYFLFSMQKQDAKGGERYDKPETYYHIPEYIGRCVHVKYFEKQTPIRLIATAIVK